MKHKRIRIIAIAVLCICIFGMTQIAYANPNTETPTTEVPADDNPIPVETDSPAQPQATGDLVDDPTLQEPSDDQRPTEPEANEPVVDTVPIKLQIRLGPHWAKTEFELSTTAGVYPEPIVVDDKGDIQLDVPEGGDFSLSVMNRSVEPPVPASIAQEQDATPEPTTTPEASDELENDATTSPQIPIIHIILFASGSVLCIGFLVFFFVRRRRNAVYYEDEEDYEDE